MGIIQSFISIKLNYYRMIARVIDPPLKRNNSSQENILRPPRVNNFQAERTPFLSISKVHLGRLLVFLEFAEDLELTQKNGDNYMLLSIPLCLSA